MQILVRFFSHLKEITGTAERTIDLPDGANVKDLLSRLYSSHPELQKWDNNILIGAGVEFVERDYRIRPDDEIAIMPPVQGG